MKKRILSIALCAVLVVAMVASMLVSVSAYTYVDEASFDVAFTTEKVTVDAQMDGVYWNSEMISNAFTYYRQRDGVAFDSWAVATKDGYYAYTVVEDTTVGAEYMEWNAKRGNVNDVSAHDKIQYYFGFTYVDGTNWWGYFETDYYANNVDGEQFANVNSTSDKTLHHVRWKAAGPNVTAADTNNIPAGVDYATKILRDSNGEEYGWVSEIFIPWTVAGNVPAAQANTLPTMGIGIQVNNDNYVAGAKEGSDANDRDGYCYSRYNDTGWWQGPGKSKFTPINFKEGSAYDYKFYTTSAAITMDGKVDAAYLNSTMIKKQSKWASSKTDNDWWMYPVATLDGVYFAGHVDDPTMNNVNNTDPGNGDMVQFYLDWTIPEYAHNNPNITFDTSKTRAYNDVYGTWMGWFQFDYEGYLTGSFDTDNTWLKGAELVINKIDNPKWNGTDPQTQYTGFDFELFVPYTNYMKNVVATQSSEYHFSLGIQVNDDATYGDSEDRSSITFDHKVVNTGLSYYAHFETLPEVQLVYADDLAPHATGITVDAVTLDGVNTDGEYDDAEIIYINKAGRGSHSLGQYRVVCDGNYVYAFFEIIDDTPSYESAKLGKYRDYVDVYVSRLGSYHQSWGGKYIPIGRDTTGNDVKVIDNKENGWTFEVRTALTAEEKALFAKGELQFGVSAQALDGYGELGANTDTRYYKYSESDGGSYWNGGGDTYATLYRRFTFGPAFTSKINSASITLGEDLTMNFYANLQLADTDAKLKVTMNDKVTYLGAEKTAVKDEYKFTFTGIAPQLMGDLINAELIVDGKVIDAVEDYSVVENINNLESDGMLDSDEAYTLAADLLAYGAAAQIYAGYNTDALVNDGWEDYATEFEAFENADRDYTEALADAKFSAAGVYHANVNKIYAKIQAEDITKVTAKINGKTVAIEKYIDGSGDYIIYSDAIKVTDFGAVYTFEITTENGTQTLTYSVNAWCAAKYDSESERGTADLAMALYNYGQSALAYIAA